MKDLSMHIMDIAQNFGVSYTAFAYDPMDFEDDPKEKIVQQELVGKWEKYNALYSQILTD